MAYPTLSSEEDQRRFMQGHVAGNEMYHTQPAYPPALPPVFTPVMNQFPANIVGFILKPATGPDGQHSWNHFTQQRMTESEQELAEIVRKDPSQNKPEEALRSKHFTGAKRQNVLDIVKQHVRTEPAFDMTWKLVSIKLNQEKTTTLTVKAKTVKTSTKSIRIILKRVSKPTLGITQHQSISFPLGARPAMVASPHEPQDLHRFPFESSHVPSPIIHQDPGHPGHPGHHEGYNPRPLFGEQMNSGPPPPPQHPLPEGMARLNPESEVVDDYPGEEYGEIKNHKPKKDEKHKSEKDEKKQKDKHKTKPPEIYIPTIRDHRRHDSKSSSKTPSLSESDGFSVIDSPMTSMSGSPGYVRWQEPKYKAKRHNDVRHDRKVSFGAHSNDSFEIIPSNSQHSNRRHKNSTSSLDVVYSEPRRYRREPWYHNDQGLVRDIDLSRLDLSEKAQDRLDRFGGRDSISRELQDRRKIERQQEIIDRLGDRIDKVETILHHGGGEVASRERPLYDRSLSDTYEIGYSGNRRRNQSGYRFR